MSGMEIETIVREVLNRLEVGQSNGYHDAPREVYQAHDELFVSARLVTLCQVEGRLAGIRRVSVRNDALVTPAVRDLLRQRHIALQVLPYDSFAVEAIADRVRLTVGVAEARFDPTNLMRQLWADGVESEQLAPGGVVHVVDALTETVGQGDCLGLILTTQTAAALCLANRNRRIRAILGDDLVAVRRGIDTIGANVLVMSPQAKSPFQLHQILQVFCRPGARSCPEAWADRLA